MQKLITVELLEEKHACSEMCHLFREVFPGGALPSWRSVRKAMDADLPMEWAVCNLLSPEAYAHIEEQVQALEVAYTTTLDAIEKSMTLKGGEVDWYPFGAMIENVTSRALEAQYGVLFLKGWQYQTELEEKAPKVEDPAYQNVPIISEATIG